MKEMGMIFDFNGTMLYDTQLQYHSWKQTLREERGIDIQKDDFLQSANGRTSRAILLHYVGDQIGEQEQNRLLACKRETYRRLCLEHPEVFHLAEGLPNVLDILRQMDVPFTIATSSHPDSVDFYFQQLDLGRWFDRSAIVCNDRNFPGKPAPDIYLLAARQIDVDPAHCIVMEDAIAGAKAARAAGIGYIILIDPDRTGAFWVGDLVDCIVHTYDEVADFLCKVEQ